MQSDPRSPEHGQYGFLQDLVRHVAYETLSKRERKSRHLAAAEHLEQAFPEVDEMAEVLASHYLAAVEAAPDAEDAAEITAKAREMLTRAGERAASLGGPRGGQALLRAGGGAGRRAARPRRRCSSRPAGLQCRRTRRPTHGNGSSGRSRCTGTQARLKLRPEPVPRLQMWISPRGGWTKRPSGSSRRLPSWSKGRRAPRSLQRSPSSAVCARSAVTGKRPRHLDRALTLGERLQLPDVFVEALISKALGLLSQGRLAEARILLTKAPLRANERTPSSSTESPSSRDNNLAVALEASDRWAEALELSGLDDSAARGPGRRRSSLGVERPYRHPDRAVPARPLGRGDDRRPPPKRNRGWRLTLPGPACCRSPRSIANRALWSLHTLCSRPTSRCATAVTRTTRANSYAACRSAPAARAGARCRGARGRRAGTRTPRRAVGHRHGDQARPRRGNRGRARPERSRPGRGCARDSRVARPRRKPTRSCRRTPPACGPASTLPAATRNELKNNSSAPPASSGSSASHFTSHAQLEHANGSWPGTHRGGAAACGRSASSLREASGGALARPDGRGLPCQARAPSRGLLSATSNRVRAPGV